MTALPFLAAFWSLSTPASALDMVEEQAILNIELERRTPQALMEYVASEDAATRARAARALGRLRHEDALDVLADLARDPDPQVRFEAIAALGQTPRSERTLLGLLAAEPDTAIRADVLRALGQTAEVSGMRILVDALNQRVAFPQVPLEARAAAEAMGQVAIRNRAALARSETVFHLTAQLDRFDLPTRRASAFALARLRPEHADPRTTAKLLDHALSEPDPATQAFLVRAVATLADAGDRLPDLYAQTARDPAPAVRIATARAARTSQWGGVVVLLDDPDSTVRQVAIQSVAGIPSLDRAALLLPMVRAGDTIEAAEAFDATGDQRLHDATAALQALAAEGLVTDPKPWLSGTRPTPIRAAAIMALDDTHRLMGLALEDDDVVVRTAAAQRLVELKPPMGYLTGMLGATDGMVAAIAAEGLGERRSSKSQKVLIRTLESALDVDLLAYGLGALDALYSGKRPKVRQVPASAVALARKYAEHEHSSVRGHARSILKAAKKSVPSGAPNPMTASYAEALRITSARIQTDQGEFIIDLAPEQAPATVWNFAKLADDGWFDGLTWHRVVPDFVAQTGDPRGDGMGGPTWTLPDEINSIRYDEGVVGMAHAGPDTAGSQWFVTLSPQPHLNGHYTAFGHVSRGMHVVDSLTQSDRIRAVIIERAAPLPPQATDSPEPSEDSLPPAP